MSKNKQKRFSIFSHMLATFGYENESVEIFFYFSFMWGRMCFPIRKIPVPAITNLMMKLAFCD